MSNAMILIHPDGRYKEINIAGTGDLLGLMQDAVGGYIETVPAQGGMVLVVDEEGKLKNKPLNYCATILQDKSQSDFDVIVGDALVCRVDGEELTGLTQWQYGAVEAFLGHAGCRVRVTKKYEDALDAVTCGHLDTTDLDPYLDAIKDALQKQIAQKSGNVQPAWIPANNPPEAGTEVLICTKSKNGSRNIDKGYWCGGRYAHRGVAAVTHWMPLPELPKED